MLQTAWYRGKNDEYLRLTRFFGTLLVINVAIGVVTGSFPSLARLIAWDKYSILWATATVA